MDLFENEIEIQQGESFNMDVILSASDIEYIPFIISSERKNIYIVLTVASEKYEKDLRYECSWWLNTDHIEKFFQTVPVDIGEFDRENVPNQISYLPTPYNSLESARTRYLYRFTYSDEENEKFSHKPYHYLFFKYDNDGNVKSAEIDTYECKITQIFPTSVTEKWNARTYFYNISLVSGELLEDVLLQKYNIEHLEHRDFPICIDENEEIVVPQPREFVEAQYHYVKRNFKDYLQEDIDIDSPLGYIENVETILRPTKLVVKSNLKQVF